MKTEAEHIFLFDCEYGDGGEWYHLEVELIAGQLAYYQCRVKSSPDHALCIDEAGRLRRACSGQVVIDVITDENDQLMDLEFGRYSLVDKLGYLIEQYTY